jgi:hypothetical protein
MRPAAPLLACAALLAAAAPLPAHAQAQTETQPAPRVSIELNAVETVAEGCRKSFVVHNGHGADIDSAVYEAVLFDAEGRVAQLALFDFAALPAARPRVRQFVIAGRGCEGFSRVLINGAETCAGAALPEGACTEGLRLKTRTDLEVLG